MAKAKTPVLVSKLEIPRDVHGLMVETRREIARSIGRVKHNKEKQETLLATLKVFTEYAKARFEDAVAREKEAAKERAEKRKVAEEINQDRAAGRVNTLRTDAEKLLAQADRIEGVSK